MSRCNLSETKIGASTEFILYGCVCDMALFGIHALETVVGTCPMAPTVLGRVVSRGRISPAVRISLAWVLLTMLLVALYCAVLVLIWCTILHIIIILRILLILVCELILVHKLILICELMLVCELILVRKFILICELMLVRKLLLMVSRILRPSITTSSSSS